MEPVTTWQGIERIILSCPAATLPSAMCTAAPGVTGVLKLVHVLMTDMEQPTSLDAVILPTKIRVAPIRGRTKVCDAAIPVYY
jgi:hypothetical protein